MRKKGLEFNLEVLVVLILLLLVAIVLLSFLGGPFKKIVLGRLPNLHTTISEGLGYKGG